MAKLEQPLLCSLFLEGLGGLTDVFRAIPKPKSSQFIFSGEGELGEGGEGVQGGVGGELVTVAGTESVDHFGDSFDIVVLGAEEGEEAFEGGVGVKGGGLGRKARPRERQR